MYWDDVELTLEEEEELIIKTAEKIHAQGIDVAALLLLESVKPLSYVSIQMGRLVISPFLPAFGTRIGLTGEKLMYVFEKRENMDKLIEYIEKLSREENKKKKEKSQSNKEKKKTQLTNKETADEKPTTKREDKKGWRRFIPF